jgi:CheY-like chemotaxis protein
LGITASAFSLTQVTDDQFFSRGLFLMTFKTILVVDDEPGIRTLLGMALPHHGFDVLLASSGEDAIALYRQHRHDISLVLLDVQMPVLDGPSTLTALQECDPQVRCCFMSGNPGQYNSTNLAGHHVFSKPFPSLNLVASTLRQLVEV